MDSLSEDTGFRAAIAELVLWWISDDESLDKSSVTFPALSRNSASSMSWAKRLKKVDELTGAVQAES